MKMPLPNFELMWSALIEDPYGDREEFHFGGMEGTNDYTARTVAELMVHTGWWDEGTKLILIRQEEPRNLKLWPNRRNI